MHSFKAEDRGQQWLGGRTQMERCHLTSNESKGIKRDGPVWKGFLLSGI